MAEAKPKTSKGRMFEVLVSFSALDKGDRFTADDPEHLAWAAQHVETGYLREATEGEPGVGPSQDGQS